MNREVDNMISLHVYMTPKANKEGELEAGIRDKWMAAMSEQRGFLRAALLKPFPDEELDKLQAAKPASTFETVAFWRTEEERLAWVARPDPRPDLQPPAGASRRRELHATDCGARLEPIADATDLPSVPALPRSWPHRLLFQRRCR